MKNLIFLATLLVSAFVPLYGGDVPPTVEDARRFMEDAEVRLLDVWMEAERAKWVQLNFITEDTGILAAKANERSIRLSVELAEGATRFDDLDLPPVLARKMKLLKLAMVLPAPGDPAKAAELTGIVSDLEGAYGSGEVCDDAGHCQSLEDLEKVMSHSRNAADLLAAWEGWRTVSVPLKADWERYADLGNEGARHLGFADLGALWRSKYDMKPDAFAAELDRLWNQVLPLYESLHCYVRHKLRTHYGEEVVGGSMIPAHLVGNMWSQSWINIYDLVAPPGEDGVDLTAILQGQDLDELEMVRYGERFFSSLGFEPLPDSFWEKSLFKKPADRDVVCHASAWDIDWVDDLRIKMCVEIDGDNFNTIHHELGHSYYQRAYNQLPLLFRDSANDGFHEAVGDTIALSVTPEYLQKLGFLDEIPGAEGDLPLLMRQAMDKVAFLPFGLLVDQWRWKVFSGEVSPELYNQAWWDLRAKYQGIEAPRDRPLEAFDAGAKYHVAANVPYSRYFLAHILQFQFHRSLCELAEVEGPLHRCSIYGSKEAGKRLIAMLEMGLSQPWPEALAQLTGSGEMDATAIIDYFSPLKTWLDEQNQGAQCGW